MEKISKWPWTGWAVGAVSFMIAGGVIDIALGGVYVLANEVSKFVVKSEITKVDPVQFVVYSEIFYFGLGLWFGGAALNDELTKPGN